MYVPGRYNTEEMCDKVVLENSGFWRLGFIPYCYKNRNIQKLRAFNYFPESHKTHNMCDEAVNAFLLTLNFVLESFVLSKIF